MMQLYKNILRPLLFKMDAEDAHSLAIKTLKLLPGYQTAYRLSMHYIPTNAVGLAAGFDKNGHLVDVIGYLGFGFIEVGSITARPSKGNPRPRMFRSPETFSLLNRMGLNGDGAEVVCERLANKKFSVPVGINIAKTNDPTLKGDSAIEDIAISVKLANKVPNLSYLAINISCPNTAGGVTKEIDYINDLLKEIEPTPSGIPIFIKLAATSKFEFLQAVVASAIANNIKGFICGNTIAGSMTMFDGIEQTGGISGRLSLYNNLDLCKLINVLKSPNQMIIGCGGIDGVESAKGYIDAGADLVQIYSGLVYQGPTLAAQITKGLSGVHK